MPYVQIFVENDFFKVATIWVLLKQIFYDQILFIFEILHHPFSKELRVVSMGPPFHLGWQWLAQGHLGSFMASYGFESGSSMSMYNTRGKFIELM